LRLKPPGTPLAATCQGTVYQSAMHLHNCRARRIIMRVLPLGNKVADSKLRHDDFRPFLQVIIQVSFQSLVPSACGLGRSEATNSINPIRSEMPEML
jgi:hypothetical protein